MHALVLAAALLLASDVEHGDRYSKTDSVDLVEVNHYYDENGAHLLDQLIFMDWDCQACRYQIRSWRLLKVPSQYPVPVKDGTGYESTWRESVSSIRVHAKKFRETWTQYDPELAERKHLPREARLELFTTPDMLPPAPPEFTD